MHWADIQMTSLASTSFTLTPFPDPDWDDNITISGDLRVRDSGFSIDYEVNDAEATLAWPAREAQPTCCDNLWAETCFEVFIASPGADDYCEYNFSPSGHWNCYQFITYRTQQTPATITTPRILNVRDENTHKCFRIDAELTQTFKSKHKLNFGISAVLQRQDGCINYYALTHCDVKPNFHLHQSFILAINNASAA